MELLDNLVEHLGINQEQAKGGAGLIFKMVKDKIGDSDFSKIAEAVPDTDDMIKAAPESSGLSSTLGGLVSGLGGSVGQMGNLAVLASGFSKLGLDKSMVGKFVPEILSFAQSKGGDSVKNLLEKVIH